MAAIFIVAGLAIHEKIEKKKEARRQKKARDELRYRELQLETSQRLARQNGHNAAPTPVRSAFVENPEDDDEEEYVIVNGVENEVSPPAYEDAVQSGERRESEWRRQMQRRRSSGNSNAGNTYMRMG